MTRAKYLELCRLFLAEKFRLRRGQIKPVEIASPVWRRSPIYHHSIDLRWVTSNRVLRYIHIARVSWRRSRAVNGDEILLLQKVKEKVAAHLALFITNTTYTARALAVAQDEEVTLLSLRPQGAGRKRSARLASRRGDKPGAARGKAFLSYSYRIVHPLPGYDRYADDPPGWEELLRKGKGFGRPI